MFKLTQNQKDTVVSAVITLAITVASVAGVLGWIRTMIPALLG